MCHLKHSLRACFIILILFDALIAAVLAAAQSDTRDTIRSIRVRKPPAANRAAHARKARKTAKSSSRRVKVAGRPKPKPKAETGKPASVAVSKPVKPLEINPRPIQQIWDLARDFLATANPHGTWSFGSAIELNGPLELFAEANRISSWYGTNQLAGWCRNDGDIAPYVVKNVSSTAWKFDSSEAGGGTAIIEPGRVALHPRSPDRYAVVEWTAPRKGTYLITASFSRAEQVQGRNSNYFVLKNGAILEGATGLLTGYGLTNSSATYRSPQLALEAGDVLRFGVGFGTDGNSNADLNLLDVIIKSADRG